MAKKGVLEGFVDWLNSLFGGNGKPAPKKEAKAGKKRGRPRKRGRPKKKR